MKRLVFAILVVVLLISSIAASVSIPLANPQIAAAEEPESGVIVLDQNTEVEYTGNSSIDETTGQLVYEYRANISSLPLYMPDLETRIDPRFYWDSENGEWYSGVNIFEVVINGSQVIAYKDGEEFQWDPIVYIGGQVIEAPDKAMLISVDPLNENYQNNILEWDYGTCVRQLRLIEGIITENYVFYEDPGADVRIDSNLYKTPNFVWIKAPYAYDADYRPLEVTVDENGKTVNASEFANAIYPVVVDDSVDIPSENYDGTIVGSEYSYSTAWSGTTGIIVDESPILWIGQSKFSDGKQPVSHDVYEVTRTFLTFDTRSIPLEAEISSSVIRLCGQYDGSNTDFNIVIQSGMPTYPHRPLLDTDYDKNLYSGNGGQFWTGGFQVDQWNYISTDPGWIKKEGYTKLCLRSSRDINGNTPSGDEAVLVWSREQGIGCAPELLIDFTVPCNYPTKPSSPSPSNGASGVSVDADLSWYSDADSYYVYFGTSSDPSYYGYTYNNYYSLPRLSEYTTYYWKILAHNDCGADTWGPLWEFTTGGAPCTNPGAFSLSSPARYATGVSIYPHLDWSDSSDVNYYNLYLGTSSNPPLYDSYIYGSEYYPSLSYDTRYYWKVEAVNDCGSRTSATWYFNTESAPVCPAPGTPVSPNPTDRATGIPITTALDWSDCTNADYYYIYFGTSQNPSYVGYSYSSYYSNLPTLSYGTTYYWRIVAINDCGTITSSESSSIWRFTTGSAPPTPTPIPTATPWSFAIITDTHIGREYPDYGGPGWNDSGSIGQEYNEDGTKMSSVWNLKEAVNWANKASNPADPDYYNVRFVVIDGDLTERAELSQFEKFKDIMQDLTVPWIPVMGNHDVWPNVGDDRAPRIQLHNDQWYSEDWYYNYMMSDAYSNFSVYMPTFSRGPEYIEDIDTETALNIRRSLQNFAFSYGGWQFIGLDFNDRGSGNESGDAAYYWDITDGTWPWLLNQLDQYAQNSISENMILLSHHPMFRFSAFWHEFSFPDISKMITDLSEYSNIINTNFYGHMHRWLGYDRYGPGDGHNYYRAVKTDENYHDPHVRIVQVFPDGTLNYDKILPEDAASFTAHCPVDLILTDPDGLVVSRTENQIPDAMYYKWDFDEDGRVDTKIWIAERKAGTYSIQVMPESYANESDTFTLTVSPMEHKWGYTPITIAQNVSISDIPTEPYTFEFTQRTTTNISYTGDISGYNIDIANLAAALSAENGSPLSGKTINFMIGNQSVSAVTDSNGVATASITLNQTPSDFYYVQYSFDGDIDYLPYYDGRPFEIINRLPVADTGGPYTSNEGSPLTFNGSASYDPDGSIVSYEWDLTGDGNFSDAQGAIVQHIWNDDYSGNIGLRVTDDCGAINIATTTVNVSNVAPTVNAGPDIASVLVGSTVSFNGSFTDPGTRDTHTIEWNFGDGTPAVTGTLTPTHAFTAGGSYTVTLTVADNDGGVGTDTLTVHVNHPPVADTGGPYTGNEGSAITFNGSTSYDPDGIITVYSWNFGDGTPTVAGNTTQTHAYGDNGTYAVTLTVTDNNGAVSTATTTATIANVTPIVNAGPDMEDVPIGSTINFNGSFTDPGWLDTHTIVWDFGDGTPTVTGTLTPTHAYTTGGDYTVTLTVTDDDGSIGTDTAAINVNVPPVADPGGPYTGNEGSPITFNGSASYDPDGIIVSFEWDIDNDGEYDDASGAIASFTWQDDYGGTVRLRVTDDTGETTIAETTVTVHNVAPAVDAGANVDYVLSGSPVDFSGGFTDPGTGDTHTIEWNFGDGTPIVTGTLTPTHTYASGGNYTVTLTVTDDDGGVGSDTLTVHVNDAPIAVPGGPYTGDEGSAITFNGSASCDPDGSIVSYEWDLNGDGDFSDAQGAVVQHTWPDDYTGDISLKVTDDEGATGIATTIVTVNNVAPEVEAGPDQSAECCVTEAAFGGSFTDPGIPDTHTVNWDFGDGATASGTLSPTHIYCDPGVYSVTLTVTDDDGGIGTDTMAVAVIDTISPEVSISSPEDGRIYINTQGPIAISYTAADICDRTPDIAITLDGVAIDEGSIDPSVLDLGGHTLTITVTDSSGNVAAASATFVIKPQLTAWGRTWGFLEWYTCGHPTTPADFFGSYSYPLVTADDSIYSWISADDSSYWRHTGYQSLPVPWEQSQLFVYKITQDRSSISNLSITWTGHGGNGDLIYHTRLKIWNYQTGSWCTLVDVTSPGSKTFQTYDRGITTNAADFIEAGTGNVSILVTSDDDGRGLTEDTEGIFTDYIALNANAAHTPSSPLTTTYTFSSGGGTNKWCWEGHVHMIDWNGGHPVSPADLANSYGYAAGGSSTYSALAASDDSRWKSDVSHDLGCCAFDRNCELFKFSIAESPSGITNIGLKWEGHGTTGETIYYTTLKIWNPSTGAWEQLHNQQNTTSDVTWIDNIAGDCSDYIDASGNLYVLACSQRSGLSGNCGIWTDYIEVTITHN